MSHKGKIWRLVPLLGVLVLLGGCTILEYDDDYWGYEDPIYSDRVYVRDYGYRNPDGLIVVYEPGLMLYRVVSYPDLYWNGGYYYRKHRSHWARSRYHRGPWAPYRHAPPRVNARHGPPPGRPVRIPPGVDHRRSVGDWDARLPSRAPLRRPTSDKGAGIVVPRPPKSGRYRAWPFDGDQRRIDQPRPPAGRPGIREPVPDGTRPWPLEQIQGRPRTPRGGLYQNPDPRVRAAPVFVNPIPDQGRPRSAPRSLGQPEQGRNPWESPGRPVQNQRSGPVEGTEATQPGSRGRGSESPLVRQITNPPQGSPGVAPGWGGPSPRDGEPGGDRHGEPVPAKDSGQQPWQSQRGWRGPPAGPT